jgi:hypothetical protein
MSQLTIRRLFGNLEKWLVPKLFNVRMTDAGITPDMGFEMQVLGGGTIRWQSFIEWLSKLRREAFSSVFAIKDLTASRPAQQKCLSDRLLMSRLALHLGIHLHLERKVFSLKALKRVERVLEKNHTANPTATPSRLKNVTIGDVIGKFRKESAAGLNEDKEKEIWETLQVVSTPAKFMSLLQSVRKDSKTGRGMVFLIACRRCKKMFIFHSFSGTVFLVRDPRRTSLSF